MKCKVLSKCTLTVNPGSVVEIDPRQFEAAKSVLAPAEKEVEVAEIETATPTKKPRKKKNKE